MNKKVTPPPVNFTISVSYSNEKKALVSALNDVFGQCEGCKFVPKSYEKQESTSTDFYFVQLTYDVFQQIYASLVVELERLLRKVQQLPQQLQNDCFNFDFEKWLGQVLPVKALIQDFSEAERAYLQARLAFSRALMEDSNDKEANYEK